MQTFKNQRAVKVLQSYFIYVPNVALKEMEKVGKDLFPTVVNWFVLCIEDDRKPSEFTNNGSILNVLGKLLKLYEFDVLVEKELKKDVEHLICI